MAITNDQFLQTIYIAYYGRAADPSGFYYWEGLYNDGTLDFAGIAENFAASQEGQDEYAYFKAFYQYGAGAITETMRGDFIDEIYQNLFNRAPDADGKAYWLDQLETGAVAPGRMVVEIANAAIVAEGDDYSTLFNKAQVAEHFTDQLVETGGTWSESLSADVEALIATTDKDSDVAVVDSQVDDAISGKGQAGETFTLTTSIDDITGTSGDDMIDGTLDAGTPANDTFTVGDSINGAGGTDTLRIVADATSFDAGIADITNVEVLKYYNKGAAALATVDLDGDGYTSFILDKADGAGAGLGISGLASTTSVEVGDLDDNTMTITYSDAAESGDSATITIGDAITGSVILAAGMETVNLKMTGAATVIDGASLAGGDATAINIEAGDDADDDQTFSGFATAADAVVTVTGKGDLDLGTLAATIKTVNAADSEGGVTAATNAAQTSVTGGQGDDALTLASPAGKLDVSTGAGDDVVVISSFDTTAGKIDGTDVKIDGGAGSEDALVSDETDFTAAAMVANVNKATNFEVLAGTGVVTALDADDYTDIDMFSFSGDLNASTFTVENDDTIALTGATTTALTVNPVLDSSDDVLNLKLDAEAASATHASITVNKMETVNIESVADTALTNTNTITNLVTQNNTKINITGDADLDMTTSVGTELDITGSDATGDLDITVVGGNDKITTGSGDDTILGAAGVDTIDAGAGDDSIDGGAGDDILTGGTGQNTFVYDTGADGMDTIKDFEAGNGGDIYDTDFATANDFVVETINTAAGSVKLDTSTGGVFVVDGTLRAAITDYTDGAEVIAAISDAGLTIDTAADQALLALTDGGNTYVYEVIEDGGGTTIEAGEITLVGTWEGVTATDLVDGNFA